MPSFSGTMKRNIVITYPNVLLAGALPLMNTRPLANEALIVFDNTIDKPRCVTAILTASIGTIDAIIRITGLDADERIIQETFTFVGVGLIPETQQTNHAFLRLTEILVTGTVGIGNYAIGVINSFGIPDYPLSGVDAIYGVKLDNASIDLATLIIDPEYGTIDFGAGMFCPVFCNITIFRHAYR